MNMTMIMFIIVYLSRVRVPTITVYLLTYTYSNLSGLSDVQFWIAIVYVTMDTIGGLKCYNEFYWWIRIWITIVFMRQWILQVACYNGWHWLIFTASIICIYLVCLWPCWFVIERDLREIISENKYASTLSSILV